jgi:regulator of sigma E protease
MGYALVILLLGLIILIHELGHLAAAKCAGIPIERFSVGFGSRVWGFKRGGTEYWLSLIPIGGYVLPRIEEGEEFFQLPLAGRVLFCFGGPMANTLTAFICLLAADIVSSGYLSSSTLTKPVHELWGMVHQIIMAIPILLDHPDKLSGIIGIVANGGQHASTDLTRLFAFFILLNVNLAVFNMLPISPLDGGKIVFDVLQSICRPLIRLQTPMAVAGWVFMIALMLYATAMDVGHLIGCVHLGSLVA